MGKCQCDTYNGVTPLLLHIGVPRLNIILHTSDQIYSTDDRNTYWLI